MAKTPKLNNPTTLGLHLAAGLEDEYLSEAQYILDDTATEKEGKKVSIQETIDNLKRTSVPNKWMKNEDVDNMFKPCQEEHDIPDWEHIIDGATIPDYSGNNTIPDYSQEGEENP